jgi:hypothetical protein
MGIWGPGSDDSDSVMDAVSECEDSENPTQEEADRILDRAFLVAQDPEMYYHALGCVIFFLSNGCHVKLKYLQKCIDTFIPYEVENNNYHNPEDRTESLKYELKMIQDKIESLASSDNPRKPAQSI